VRVALHDADKTDFPNLALMKISSFHKVCGDSVEWYQPGSEYDRVYSSKVFTSTPTDDTLPADTIKGGTGYDITAVLPDYIEACFPDYSLYNLSHSMGFLTRGCPRKCPWCFVPAKEGEIRAASTIQQIMHPSHSAAVLMDNNVLAHQHGIHQIEEIARLGIKVDFNQGLDARLIDAPMARLLSKVKWLSPVRLACDDSSQIETVRRAVETMRWHNVSPRNYWCYVLVKDVADAVQRVRFLKGISVEPFCQPYLDMDGTPPTRDQRRLARWVNNRQLYKTRTWGEYQVERGELL